MQLLNGLAENRGIINHNALPLRIVFRGGGLLLNLGKLLCAIYPKEISYHNNCKYNTHNAKRISHCIAQGNILHPICILCAYRAAGQRIREGLLGGSKAGGICNRAIEDTHHCNQICACYHVNNIGRNGTQKDNSGCQGIQGHSSALKRGEETRTNLQAHRIDKENKPKLLDKMKRSRVHSKSKMAHCYCKKENPGNTQRDSLKIYPAKQYSKSYCNCKDQNSMGYRRAKEKISEPFHNTTKNKKFAAGLSAAKLITNAKSS